MLILYELRAYQRNEHGEEKENEKKKTTDIEMTNGDIIATAETAGADVIATETSLSSMSRAQLWRACAQVSRTHSIQTRTTH